MAVFPQDCALFMASFFIFMIQSIEREDGGGEKPQNKNKNTVEDRATMEAGERLYLRATGPYFMDFAVEQQSGNISPPLSARRKSRA